MRFTCGNTADSPGTALTAQPPTYRSHSDLNSGSLASSHRYHLTNSSVSVRTYLSILPYSCLAYHPGTLEPSCGLPVSRSRLAPLNSPRFIRMPTCCRSIHGPDQTSTLGRPCSRDLASRNLRSNPKLKPTGTKANPYESVMGVSPMRRSRTPF